MIQHSTWGIPFERTLRRWAALALHARDGHTGVRRHARDFSRFARQGRDDVLALSHRRLGEIISHAYRTSPYYREVWQARGIDPERMSFPDDLGTLPILTKDVIDRERERLVSSAHPSHALDVSHTGGTNGAPTRFYRDRRATSIRIGRQLAILERCGYRHGERRALVWGAHGDLPDLSCSLTLRERLRRFAGASETLDCTIMTAASMEQFCRRLQTYRPQVLYGYPNALAELASFVLAGKAPAPRVRTIICTAERLTEEQRGLLTRAFNGTVFNLYCSREHGCMGFECSARKGFHLDIGSIFVEVLDGGASARPGHTGDIVVTDLLNYGMPLVRYRNGDRGVLSPYACDCGCPLPILASLDGRISDTLYRADGSSVAGLMLIDFFEDQPNVKELQIVQDSLAEVDVLLSVLDAFTWNDVQIPMQRLGQVLGEGIRIRPRIVAEIPRHPQSGKVQEIVCRARPASTPSSTTPAVQGAQ